MIVKNIALLGQKDHGESTLIGQLLMQTGAATKVRIKEAQEYSKRQGKAFEPAFILDSFTEERLNEMTYDTTRAEIKHRGIAFALIDVPGHEELIKNMISGASYGELALLLVSAKKGEGIADQTKRHLFIARMLGIERLVVAVNKMDTRDYEEEAFEAVKEGLSRFISKMGFSGADVRFVPISAYKGEGLTRRSKAMRWYRGKPLIDVLYENAKRGGVKREGALRIIVQGKIPGAKADLVAGRVVSGSVRVGDRVVVLPQGSKARVDGISVKGARAGVGRAGENVALALTGYLPKDMRGTLMAGAAHTPRITERVRLKIFVTGAFGKSMRVKFNGITIPCKNVRVLRTINTVTGEANDSRKPRVLDAVEADVTLSRGVPVEDPAITKELGRFVLYNGDKFAGIGILE